MDILVESPEFVLAHDPTTNWLHARWRGVQSTDAVTAGFALILAQVRRTGSPKILNDSAQDEDGWGWLVRWLSHDLFPQLAAQGVVAVAWVLPTDVRARGDVYRAVAAIDQPITDVFTDTESAYSWLRNLPAASLPAPRPHKPRPGD